MNDFFIPMTQSFTLFETVFVFVNPIYFFFFYNAVFFFIEFCALMIILSYNPIYSIIFLILCFIATSLLFIFLKIEYISLILIIVYLGAVCVLFLFVIMMLNIKLIELKREINFVPFFFFLISLFLIYFFKNVFFLSENFFIFLLELNSYFVTLFINISSFFLDNHFYADDFFFLSYESGNPIENDFMKKIGLILYTVFSYQFILSSLVLLVAMIGAIFITLEITLKSKKQILYYQIKKNKGLIN